MKTRFSGMLFLICAICIAPAKAQQPFGDDAFIRDLSDIKNVAVEVPLPAAPGIVPDAASGYTGLNSEAEISAQLDNWMGIFNDMELQPTADLTQMSQTVLQGLGNGAYDGLILGESHGVDPEITAGIRMIKDILQQSVVNIRPIIASFHMSEFPPLPNKFA
jgi:hypothetical protein